MIESVFAWLAVGAGFVAAMLWLAASFVKIPPFPDVGLDSASSVFEPVRSALGRSSKINAWAAGVTAGAALFQTVSMLCHQITLQVD